MAISLSDSEFYFGPWLPIIAVIVLIIIYFSTLYAFFGTYFLRTAIKNYQRNKSIRKRYYELFTTRDSLLHHIAWSKSRGDMDEARSMTKQIIAIDKEIDNLESSNKQIFGQVDHDSHKGEKAA